MTQSSIVFELLSTEFHQKESLTHILLNESPHFMGITDSLSNKFITINEAGRKMFGMKSEQEILSFEIPDIFYNTPTLEEISRWGRLTKAIGSFEQEVRMKTKS